MLDLLAGDGSSYRRFGGAYDPTRFEGRDGTLADQVLSLPGAEPKMRCDSVDAIEEIMIVVLH